ncbi:MAG: serine/threonine-protein kinase [Gemmataceae bacterium]
MSTAAPPPDPDPADDYRRRWEAAPQDVAAFLAAAGPLSPADRVAVLCADQEARWRRGDRVPAEAYFARFPAVRADPEYGPDLVFHEYLLREGVGDPPPPAELAARFPDLADALAAQLEVHRAVDAGADVLADWPRVPGYEVRAELGRGGMGVVYEARHLALGRPVALKVLRDGLGPDAADRFRAEAAALAKLAHPNVVRVYEVGETAAERPAPFIALEYVAGGSLADAAGGRPVAPHTAAALVAGAARGVAAAHVAGIVHRDLKPANVLLDGDTPKVADFGLARDEGAAGRTETGVVAGTPAYMAPEQAAGRSKDAGPAADVYALGAVLYELLAGRPPFQAATPALTLQLVLTADPVPLRRLQPGTPRDLETVALKCLEKVPARRYPSAAALADDLDRFRAGLPVVARPVSAAGRGWRWCRRNPRVAGLAAALVVAVAAGTGGVAAQWVRAERAAADAGNAAATSERNFRAALEANDEVVGLAARLKPLAGTQTAAVVGILGAARDRYDRLAATVGPDPAVRAGRGRMLAAFSEVYVEAGDTGAALAAADEAAGLFRELLAESPDDAAAPDWRAGLGLALERRGVALFYRGDPAGSRGAFDESLTVHRALAAADPARELDLSTTLHWLAAWELARGDLPKAGGMNAECVALRERAARGGGPNEKMKLASAVEQAGGIEWKRNDVRCAADHYRRALDLYRAAAGADPGNTEHVRGEARVRLSLGQARARLGDDAAGRADIAAAGELARRFAALNPGNVHWSDLTTQAELAENDYAKVTDLHGALRRQIALLDRTRDAYHVAVARDPGNATHARFVAASEVFAAQAAVGLVNEGVEPPGFAEPRVTRAVALAEAAARREPDAMSPVELAQRARHAAADLDDPRDPARAADHRRRGRVHLDYCRRRAAADPESEWWEDYLAHAYRTAGAAVRLGPPHDPAASAEAERLFRESLDRYERLRARRPADDDLAREVAETHGRLRAVFFLRAVGAKRPGERPDVAWRHPAYADCLAHADARIRVLAEVAGRTGAADDRRAWLTAVLDRIGYAPNQEPGPRERAAIAALDLLAAGPQPNRSDGPLSLSELARRAAGGGTSAHLRTQVLLAEGGEYMDDSLGKPVSVSQNVAEVYAGFFTGADTPAVAAERAWAARRGTGVLRDRDRAGKLHPVHRRVLADFAAELDRRFRDAPPPGLPDHLHAAWRELDLRRLADELFAGGRAGLWVQLLDRECRAAEHDWQRYVLGKLATEALVEVPARAAAAAELDPAPLAPLTRRILARAAGLVGPIPAGLHPAGRGRRSGGPRPAILATGSIPAAGTRPPPGSSSRTSGPVGATTPATITSVAGSTPARLPASGR